MTVVIEVVSKASDNTAVSHASFPKSTLVLVVLCVVLSFLLIVGTMSALPDIRGPPRKARAT